MHHTCSAFIISISCFVLRSYRFDTRANAHTFAVAGSDEGIQDPPRKTRIHLPPNRLDHYRRE